jgi:ATP adenylyltransferase
MVPSAAVSQPLWAPWRMEYILGPKDKSGCVFCVDDAAPESELADRLVVFRGARTLVMLNRYPFAAGHLLVMPRAHKSELAELGSDHDLLFRIVRESVARLKVAVSCHGVNVGINLGEAAGAGIAEHLHVHVVPRWEGDSNFMPVIADKRIVPQALADTRKHLLTAFAGLSEDSVS